MSHQKGIHLCKGKGTLGYSTTLANLSREPNSTNIGLYLRARVELRNGLAEMMTWGLFRPIFSIVTEFRP
jgi:hypothetical protein